MHRYVTSLLPLLGALLCCCIAARAHILRDEFDLLDTSKLAHFLEAIEHPSSELNIELPRKCEHFWLEVFLNTRSYMSRDASLNRRFNHHMILDDFESILEWLEGGHSRHHSSHPMTLRSHSNQAHELSRFVRDCMSVLDTKYREASRIPSKVLNIGFKDVSFIRSIKNSFRHIPMPYQCGHFWFAISKSFYASRLPLMPTEHAKREDMRHFRMWLYDHMRDANTRDLVEYFDSCLNVEWNRLEQGGLYRLEGHLGGHHAGIGGHLNLKVRAYKPESFRKLSFGLMGSLVAAMYARKNLDGPHQCAYLWASVHDQAFGTRHSSQPVQVLLDMVDAELFERLGDHLSALERGHELFNVVNECASRIRNYKRSEIAGDWGEHDAHLGAEIGLGAGGHHSLGGHHGGKVGAGLDVSLHANLGGEHGHHSRRHGLIGNLRRLGHHSGHGELGVDLKMGGHKHGHGGYGLDYDHEGGAHLGGSLNVGLDVNAGGHSDHGLHGSIGGHHGLDIDTGLHVGGGHEFGGHEQASLGLGLSAGVDVGGEHGFGVDGHLGVGGGHHSGSLGGGLSVGVNVGGGSEHGLHGGIHGGAHHEGSLGVGLSTGLHVGGEHELGGHAGLHGGIHGGLHGSVHGGLHGSGHHGLHLKHHGHGHHGLSGKLAAGLDLRAGLHAGHHKKAKGGLIGKLVRKGLRIDKKPHKCLATAAVKSGFDHFLHHNKHHGGHHGAGLDVGLNMDLGARGAGAGGHVELGHEGGHLGGHSGGHAGVGFGVDVDINGGGHGGRLADLDMNAIARRGLRKSDIASIREHARSQAEADQIIGNLREFVGELNGAYEHGRHQGHSGLGVNVGLNVGGSVGGDHAYMGADYNHGTDNVLRTRAKAYPRVVG